MKACHACEDCEVEKTKRGMRVVCMSLEKAPTIPDWDGTRTIAEIKTPTWCPRLPLPGKNDHEHTIADGDTKIQKDAYTIGG